MLTATERNSLDLVGDLNAWDIPAGDLLRVNAIPPFWTDGGRWRVEDAKVASHTKIKRFRRDPVTGRLQGRSSYEVIVPGMIRTRFSPEWEVTNCGRTVCFVDKSSFPTPDHALAFALASTGWRIIP